MSNHKLKKFVLCLSALAAVCAAPASEAQTVVKVAVASNFFGTLNQLITIYKNSGFTYWAAQFDVTSGATGDFLAAINTALSAPSGTTPYDLFVAADPSSPASLRSSFPSVVETPFFYAEGRLVLWSPNGPDVSTAGSAGLPAPGSYSYANGQIAIANPSTAPYGKAAQQVLARVTGVTYPGGANDSIFTQYTTIGNTFSAVQANYSNPAGHPVPNMGFVAKAQLCDGSGGVQLPPSGGTYFEYTPASTAGNAPHDRILQNVEVITGRSGSTTAATEEFATFLTSPTEQAIILNNCYTL